MDMAPLPDEARASLMWLQVGFIALGVSAARHTSGWSRIYFWTLSTLLALAVTALIIVQLLPVEIRESLT